MKDSCQAMRQAIFGLFVLIKNVSQSELPPQIVPIRKEVLLSALSLAGQTRPFFFLKRRDLGLAVLGKKIIQRLGEQILNGRVMLGREKT